MVHTNLVNKLSDLIELLAYKLNVENLEFSFFSLTQSLMKTQFCVFSLFLLVLPCFPTILVQKKKKPVINLTKLVL